MNFLEEKVINAIVLLGNIECIILFTETLHEISIFCKIKIIIPKTLFNELFLNKFFRSPPSFSWSRYSHMPVYTSLLVKFFGLKEHILKFLSNSALRGNHCAYFLVKVRRSIRLVVTFWQASHRSWSQCWGLIPNPVFRIFLFFRHSKNKT